MDLPTFEQIVEALSLVNHPEGGFYYRNYRSQQKIQVEHLGHGYSGERSLTSAIYYLVHGKKPSKLHRLRTDEIWHFYFGSPFDLIELTPYGELKRTRMGNDLLSGHKLQHVVSAGNWFGGFTTQGSGYSLLGCTISPGFEEMDFQLADRDSLIKEFPSHEELIRLLS